MINEFEVAPFIIGHIPEIDTAYIEAGKKGCVYKNMHSLINYTVAMVKEHNYIAVKECFTTVDSLYDKGNNIVKNAVENVYVFALGNILHVEEAVSYKLLAIMPLTLYTLYINHINTFGC